MKLTRCDQHLFGVNKRSVAAETFLLEAQGHLSALRSGSHLIRWPAAPTVRCNWCL